MYKTHFLSKNCLYILIAQADSGSSGKAMQGWQAPHYAASVYVH